MKTIQNILVASATMLLSQAAFAYSCSGLPTWQNASVYVGGNQVQFNQNAYKANWWTQGKNPESYSGKWQEWTLLGKCDSAGTTPPINCRFPTPMARTPGPFKKQLRLAVWAHRIRTEILRLMHGSLVMARPVPRQVLPTRIKRQAASR